MELEKEPSTELCPRCGSILYTRGCYECSHNSCMFRWNTSDFDKVKAGMRLLDYISHIEQLEKLSDKIRQGIPVDFTDAIEVIEYQDMLKRRRKPSLLAKFKTCLNKLLKR